MRPCKMFPAINLSAESVSDLIFECYKKLNRNDKYSYYLEGVELCALRVEEQESLSKYLQLRSEYCCHHVVLKLNS